MYMLYMQIDFDIENCTTKEFLQNLDNTENICWIWYTLQFYYELFLENNHIQYSYFLKAKYTPIYLVQPQ